MKSLTGERALYKSDILPIVDKMKVSRFGIESLLYLYYHSRNLRISSIHLKGLKHKDKYKKTTIKQASINYLSEGLEIACTTIKNYDLLLSTISNKFKRA
jgi:hypothetical protein